jgi:aspartyl-tRNA(Asn)/glutamyl-tRNA(Gln) amidotransferase subunit C
MSNVILTEEQVDHVAHLARLEITPEERSLFASQLGEILKYVGHLQQLDTSEAVAAFQVFPQENVFREDVPGVPLPVEAVLANAPEKDGDYFKMPKIIDGGS